MFNHENKVIRIGMKNFETLIKKERSHVFLACVSDGIDFPEQVKPVKNIWEKYGHLIKVCILNTDENDSFGLKYGLDGTPTFYIFYEGEEIARLLGMEDNTGLEKFVLSAIVKGKNGEKKYGPYSISR